MIDFDNIDELEDNIISLKNITVQGLKDTIGCSVRLLKTSEHYHECVINGSTVEGKIVNISLLFDEHEISPDIYHIEVIWANQDRKNYYNYRTVDLEIIND